MILLPLLILFVAFAGESLFLGVLCVVGAIALSEFYTMGLTTLRRAEGRLAIAAGVLLSLGMLFGQARYVMPGMLALVILSLTVIYLFRFQDLKVVCQDLGITLLGLLYVPFLLNHAGLLRVLPDGRKWVFLVFFIVMASDSFAYFIGRKLGRRKLYEVVSPNKSLEGALGGLVGGVVGALVFKTLFFAGLRPLDVLMLGIGVGAFSQVGDLVESMFKRSFDVKDSGTLIPGHGGLLDRLDSLLFAFPITYYYALWVAA